MECSPPPEGRSCAAANSAADLALAPTLERFAEQLKVLKPEFPALDAGRPAIARW